MTIFDTLKYPVNGDRGINGVYDSVPKEIFSYWYKMYYIHNGRWEDDLINLRRIIAEYNTEDCEISNYNKIIPQTNVF